MKKILLLFLFSVFFCTLSYAQVEDTTKVELRQVLLEKTNTQKKTVFSTPPPNSLTFVSKNEKIKIKHEFGYSILLGTDDVADRPYGGFDAKDIEEFKDKTEGQINAGFDFVYKLKFYPGERYDSTFIVNRCGFGYSFGAEVAGDLQKNHGFTCDILLTTGIELGASRIGFGLDALIGTGNVYGYSIIADAVEDDALNIETTITQRNCMALKYGGQIWIKLNFGAGSLSNFIGSEYDTRDIRLFVRYIKSHTPPDGIARDDYAVSFNTYSDQSLQLGIGYFF